MSIIEEIDMSFQEKLFSLKGFCNLVTINKLLFLQLYLLFTNIQTDYYFGNISSFLLII